MPTPTKTAIPNPRSSNPLERVVSPQVAEVVTNTAIGSSVVSGLFLNSYTNSVNNVLRLTRYCANANNVGDLNPLLYVPGAPVALGSEESESAVINGVIISTTSLMAATFAAFLLTGYLQNHMKQSPLKHGHQTGFNATPEHFLLTVLVGRIWERSLVHNAQARQARDRFIGQHGCPVIGHQCAR